MLQPISSPLPSFSCLQISAMLIVISPSGNVAANLVTTPLF
jgi:hypothetical protein